MSKEKSPAFQFYPKDLLSDINWLMMNYWEKGMYWQLISVCWLEGSLPADLGALARIVQLDVDTFKGGWVLVGKCFQPHCSDCTRLVHPRLELERQKQADWAAKSAEGGRRSAHKRKHYKNISAEQGGYQMVPTKRQPKVNSSSPSPSSIASSNNTPKSPQGDLCEIGKRCNGKFQECTDAFEIFWKAYPRHSPPKAETKKKWCIAYHNGIDMDQLIAYITEAKMRWDDPKYITMPTTFLNQRRWEGDLPPLSKSKQLDFNEARQFESSKDDSIKERFEKYYLTKPAGYDVAKAFAEFQELEEKKEEVPF